MNIFGIYSSQEDARIALIPVPWEVTTSYGSGTSLGASIIEKASHQVDLWDSTFGNIVELKGAFMFSEMEDIRKMNNTLKPKAQRIIFHGDTMTEEEIAAQKKEINGASEGVNDLVYLKTLKNLKDGKIVGVVGGDHSCPLGAMKAVSETFGNDYGVLHFDAHADLRKHYQGFNHSHASIMYNLMNAPFAPKKLVQVGIRDFCEEELIRIEKSEGKIKTFFDESIKERMLSGTSWEKICDEIIGSLPQKVYISFDIDGLEPSLCPGTGTPVVGGLSFSEFNFLFKKLLENKKKIIGFDLCEVSGSEWDGNVGARVLFKLCSLALASQN